MIVRQHLLSFLDLSLKPCDHVIPRLCLCAQLGHLCSSRVCPGLSGSQSCRCLTKPVSISLLAGFDLQTGTQRATTVPMNTSAQLSGNMLQDYGNPCQTMKSSLVLTQGVQQHKCPIAIVGTSLCLLITGMLTSASVCTHRQYSNREHVGVPTGHAPGQALQHGQLSAALWTPPEPVQPLPWKRLFHSQAAAPPACRLCPGSTPFQPAAFNQLQTVCACD